MKCKQVRFTALTAVLLFGTSTVVYGLGPVVGPSPQTNTLTITVTCPTLVGIVLGNNSSINLGTAPNSTHYPPGTFPGYYEDNTNPISAGPTTSLFVWTNSSTGYNLKVQAGAANYYTGLPVSQSYYCDKTLYPSEARTADGTANPGVHWTAFSSAAQTSVASNSGPTSGWDVHNQIFELKMTGSEPSGSGVVTMTYTITANP